MKNAILAVILTIVTPSAFALNSICEVSQSERVVHCVLENSKGRLEKLNIKCFENKSCQETRIEIRELFKDSDIFPSSNPQIWCALSSDC